MHNDRGMDKSKSSYAEIASPNKYTKVAADWPDLRNKPNGKIKPPEVNQTDPSDKQLNDLTDLTNAIKRLNTTDASETGTVDNEPLKSRDEIRTERRLRRRHKNDLKREQLLEDKIARLREPKSQKVQVVDPTVMERFLSNRRASPIRNRMAGKSNKSHSAMKINLFDLINTKVVKPIDRSSIQSRSKTKAPISSGTQCHKGKRSEVMKKKYVSKLKKNILMSRLQRTEIKVAEESNETKSAEATQTTEEKAAESPGSGVQFSRKFRP